MRVLGVASARRLPQLPDVPTVEEVLGFPFAINTWYAAYAPKGTPRPIVDKLNAAFNKALKQPDLVARAKELAIELVDDSTPRSAKKFYDDQMAFWDPIIKEWAPNRNDRLSFPPPSYGEAGREGNDDRLRQ